MTALPFISFGDDIQRPDLLETRSTSDVLLGIQSGLWRNPVTRVRSLPHNSAEQKSAKRALPYATWAGVFSHRANSWLVRHSGQIGIDLDGLGEAGAVAVLQAAVADRFCLAAFRSARGEGVRLIFRIPPCSPGNHATAFQQVAEHVRNTYGRDPDEYGKDVSRASFVSFDEGLWCYPNARVLPVILDLSHSDSCCVSRCVPPAVYSGQLAMTAWSWMGRYHVGSLQKEDGTTFTHTKLLILGKAMALHAERIKHTLTHQDFDEAARAWFVEHQRKGLRLRGDLDEYRAELRRKVEGARGKHWFKASVEKWTRWTRHPDFPKDPVERLLFAIRKHCQEAGRLEFFIGARDAGLVCGVSYRSGARLLKRLVNSGQLKLLTVPDRRLPFHSYDYRLTDARGG